MIAIDASWMFCLFIGLAIGLVCGFGIGYFSAFLYDASHGLCDELEEYDPYGLMHADD